MHRLALGWSNPRTGRDFGRRPRQPAGNVLATRTSVPAPKTSADARRPRRCQGPSLVTQDTPIGNPGPFQAGGQAPPIHWVTVSQQGEFNGIPGPVQGISYGRSNGICKHRKWSASPEPTPSRLGVFTKVVHQPYEEPFYNCGEPVA